MRDLTPSSRKGSAQRTFATTLLVVNAFIVFFSLLTAHGLRPESRLTVWIIGAALVLAMIVTAMRARSARTAAPFRVGALLHVPMALLGLWVLPMWIIGVLMGALYVYAIIRGHQMDREKDQIDARWHAEHPEGTGDPDGDVDGITPAQDRHL